MQTDVLIIGCGIAGSIAALELADQGVNVVLLGAGESASEVAQGGIIYQGHLDSPDLLAQDIHQAGAGLCHHEAVDLLVRRGPSLVKELLIDKYQVPFEKDAEGAFLLTEEAAHACPRILYHRDQTGRGVMEQLKAHIAKHPHICFKPYHTAVDLITLSHHSKNKGDIYAPLTCRGAYVMDNERQQVEILYARETFLATGGIGEVFLHTTNPAIARGDGLAMAFRAGARIMNLEYVQFHPTALYVPAERRFLISEALRGSGAELLSANHEPFMHRYHEKGALAPRDVVARSMYQEMLRHHVPHLWLDISSRDADWLQQRFPSIYAHALSRGYDLTQGPIPVVPAAHYSCGGVAVDGWGKTTIRNLRAIGEVACTGVHGANRLASTSLLEGLVWAKSAAEDCVHELGKGSVTFPEVEEWVMGDQCVDQALIQQDWMTIKQTMWNYVGLIRDQNRLNRAFKMLQQLKWEIDSFYEKGRLTPELLGLRNGVLTALLIVQGALRNKHSLGCHYRLN